MKITKKKLQRTEKRRKNLTKKHKVISLRFFVIIDWNSLLTNFSGYEIKWDNHSHFQIIFYTID